MTHFVLAVGNTTSRRRRSGGTNSSSRRGGCGGGGRSCSTSSGSGSSSLSSRVFCFFLHAVVTLSLPREVLISDLKPAHQDYHSFVLVDDKGKFLAAGQCDPQQSRPTFKTHRS